AGLHAAVRLDNVRTLVVGERRAFVEAAATITDAAGATIVPPTAASVLGNLLQARGVSPVVQLGIAGDCLFNDNRGELLLRGSRVAVHLDATPAIVNASRVRGGEIAIELVSDPKQIAVVGNVTTGPILCGNAALGAPWDVLNVRA